MAGQVFRTYALKDLCERRDEIRAALDQLSVLLVAMKRDAIDEVKMPKVPDDAATEVESFHIALSKAIGVVKEDRRRKAREGSGV